MTPISTPLTLGSPMTLSVIQTPTGTYVGTVVQDTTNYIVLENACSVSRGNDEAVDAFAFATKRATETTFAYSSCSLISAKSPRVVLYAPILIRVDVPGDLAPFIAEMIK